MIEPKDFPDNSAAFFLRINGLLYSAGITLTGDYDDKLDLLLASLKRTLINVPVNQEIDQTEQYEKYFQGRRN